ncbi:site-specific DNA-methyltransferase [Xanthomonas arboricola pv. juglandis]|uniref:site-specific DNA-methyltransferase n=1 Tax=Xanthomonas TaxID=338 RepID=UPI000E5C3029|nr:MULTISPECIES: site-specific DNA-methyltransferase [Xanthomonas]CAD1796111.1 site-specific DNA-methyltransferase [Xanthomonas sp. CPBF 426]CAG2095700.1 site-specific DNA-methyltransferase [Xanthomonas euroxanthea]SYZ51437.1 site-specific DNA-methyltransferase [Xanthomonas arboricola pv. juglandis]
MTPPDKATDLLTRLGQLGAPELRRLLVEHLTKRKLGLTWERNAIEHDEALNADVVLPQLVSELSHKPADAGERFVHRNLVIEGDNFDSLRLLKATHAGRIRVIYIDPPYNTGNKDWVYNDRYVGKADRWRHSQWLEFLYRRLLLARELLAPDGVILVSINDENRSRLELLMDEVFPGRRLGSLVWRTKDTGNDLSQRFSHVHEHVLVYANPGFTFNGRATDRKKFRNSDDDERGDWSPQPLTANKTFVERPNTYYPIQNPMTGYWYPCDPDSTWRFASEQEIRRRLDNDEDAIAAALDGLRSDTIEQLIKKKLIYFPPCNPGDVMRFDTRHELLSAIREGRGPVLPKKKTPLLRENLPDLDFWIGKPIATGRPSRKEHWTARPEEERLAPLSSWIAGVNEEINDDNEYIEAVVTMRSTRGGVATEEVKSVLGGKAFPYPKPLSLLKGLLEQATHKEDTVLDFFAGSGTTAHALLQLNAEDGGQRHFILCSSTEATDKEPDKNVCRDVCAARVRRVIAGYNGNAGFSMEQGGEFAYLKLNKLAVADLPFEAKTGDAAALLSLRLAHAVWTFGERRVQHIARTDGCDILLCAEVNTNAVDELAAWPRAHNVQRLSVYCDRPVALQEALEERGIDANCHSLADALLGGQAGGRA